MFSQHNRKYIGSKTALLDFICKTIEETVGDELASSAFLDLFAGTGVVAGAFVGRAKQVLACDLLYANYVTNRAFLCTNLEKVNLARFGELLQILNRLEGTAGYLTENYGDTYFTWENAARIEAVREQIELWYRNNAVGEQEYYLLLASLLYAADKVANTCGQYDAYLKHLGKGSYDARGVHLVDGNVYRRLRLESLELKGGNCQVFCRDANSLIEELEVELLYLDPPYNVRQYCDNYHVLENIARWEKPPLFGKTRKFDRRGLKSRYSRKKEAAGALAELVAKARCRYLFLSYNSEGLITDQQIISILESRGQVTVKEELYPVFGKGAGRARRRNVLERLFVCKFS